MNCILKVRFLIILTLLTGSYTTTFGQRKKKKNHSEVVQMNDSLSSNSQYDITEFPNLYKHKFFYNESQLRDIKSLDTPETQEAMYLAIIKYVKNFGIENFSKSIA